MMKSSFFFIYVSSKRLGKRTNVLYDRIANNRSLGESLMINIVGKVVIIVQP